MQHSLLRSNSMSNAQAWCAIDGRVIAMLLSLAYFYLVPAPLLSLPGLLLFLVLAWGQLDVALALLPVTFPFWFVPKLLFGDKVFPLSEIVLAACLIVALAQLVQGLITRRWRISDLREQLLEQLQRLRQSTPATLALIVGVLLFALGVSLGVLVARRRPEALRAWRWELLEPLVYLALLLCYGRRRETLVLLIWLFLGSALLVATLAIVQVFWFHVTFTPLATGNRLVPYPGATGAMPRATAFIYGSSNSLGAWLARALPLALALALAPTTRRWPRAAALLVLLAGVPALILSDSRGAEIATLLVCLLVVCVLLRPVRVAVVVAAPIALLLALWQRTALSALLLAGHNDSGAVRLLIWTAAWHMIRDHLFFGIGPDQFLYYYSNLYTSRPYWIPFQNGHITPAAYEPNLAQPHNLLLDLWLSGGLLALLGFLTLLVALTLIGWQSWRTARVDTTAIIAGLPIGALTLGIMASVLAGLVHGMVDSAYFAPDLALAFWWAVAALLLLRCNSSEQRNNRQTR